MPDTTIQTTNADREILTIALRQPGWARTAETIVDAASAIKKLRAIADANLAPTKVEVPLTLDRYEMDAARAAINAAVGNAIFGPDPALVDVLSKFGIRSSREAKD